MSYKEYRERKEAAEQHRSNDQYENAGNAYTLAAYEALGESECTNMPLESDSTETAMGLRCLLSAALCYRLAENPPRAQNRGNQGILICEDIRNYVAKYGAQKGLMSEYIGDFHLLAGLGNPRPFYTTAGEVYEDVENHLGWQGEPEFQINITFFLLLASAAGHDIPRDVKGSVAHHSLLDRINYKSDNFAEIVETMVRSGEWKPD